MAKKFSKRDGHNSFWNPVDESDPIPRKMGTGALRCLRRWRGFRRETAAKIRLQPSFLLIGSLALLLLLRPVVSRAAPIDCGGPPPVADETLKGTIQGKANMLTQFFGQAELGGQLEAARTDIFSRYPQAERARGIAYLQYVMCSLLAADQSLSIHDKIDELMRIKEILQPETKPAEAVHEPHGGQSSTGACSPNTQGGVSGSMTITCSSK